ncbi:MAG: ABC transporter permease [Candidatus Pristimantibacillus sp.]
MLKTLNTLMSIRVSIAINIFIYYMQRLPLIGKLFNDELYANRAMKKIFSILVQFIRLLWGFALRIINVGLVVYLPVVSFGKTLTAADQLSLFVHILFVFSFIVAGISSTAILEPKREKYIAVKVMRLSPTLYMRASLGYRYCAFFVYLLPAMILFGSMLKLSFGQALLMTVVLTMWRVLCEYLHLKLFEKTGVVLIKQVAIVWIIIVLGCIAAYMPLFVDQMPIITDAFVLSVPFVLIVLALGVFAAVQLARYSDYRTVVDTATKRDDPLLDIGRMITDANKASVQSKDHDYALDHKSSTKLHPNKGYAYLNTIFFARHRSLISQPVTKRLVIIGVLAAIGIAGALMFKQQVAQWNINIGPIFSFLFITLYFLSVGERICRAMFYNCDLSLLRYSFYRDAAYRHFRIRLMKIAGLNLLIAAALGAALTLIILTAGLEASGLELLYLWVSILSLSIFFSTHHLFLYYILQPYTTELNIKNPLYHVLNMTVSSASGLFIIFRFPFYIFALITFTLMLLYLIIAILLIRQKGHKTFRVK